MNYWILIGGNIIFIVICCFILLFPFRSKENRSIPEKGLIRGLLKNRFGAVHVLNNLVLVAILSTLLAYTRDLLKSIIITLIFIMLPTFILWYPNYLEKKHPDKYKGIWIKIGNWLGDPRDVFHQNKR